MGFISGAKLPLYAFKRLNKISGEKDLLKPDDTEPPVAFLDSLLLGEVYMGKFLLSILFFLPIIIMSELADILLLDGSGRIVRRKGSFGMMSLLAKPRSLPFLCS